MGFAPNALTCAGALAYDLLRMPVQVFDAPGAIDETTLMTDETAQAISARREQAVMHEIDAKHPVRVATHGVLGHIDHRAEHPRFRGRDTVLVRLHGEHEEAVRAELAACQSAGLPAEWSSGRGAQAGLAIPMWSRWPGGGTFCAGPGGPR